MPVFAQSRSERVDQIASMLNGSINDKASASDTVYTDARTGDVIQATPAQLMRKTMTSVDFDAIPARLALEIWSSQTNVPLVVNWASLEAQGIDPAAPVTLTLGKVPAETVLKLIVQQVHPDPIADDELLLEVQEWYVRVMTRGDALKRTTTRLYFIGDLLMDIPNFDGAPNFDLNAALSNTNSGGSNGGGGNQATPLFGDPVDDNGGEKRLTKAEKAERIVEMIRTVIEPDIWRENGGEYGSVRYYRGMLVVKAPQFVQEQIGGLSGESKSKSAVGRKSASRSSANSSRGQSSRHREAISGNVAGVAPKSPAGVR